MSLQILAMMREFTEQPKWYFKRNVPFYIIKNTATILWLYFFDINLVVINDVVITTGVFTGTVIAAWILTGTVIAALDFRRSRRHHPGIRQSRRRRLDFHWNHRRLGFRHYRLDFPDLASRLPVLELPHIR